MSPVPYPDTAVRGAWRGAYEIMHGAGHGAGRARAGPRMILRAQRARSTGCRTCVLGADRRQAHVLDRRIIQPCTLDEHQLY